MSAKVFSLYSISDLQASEKREWLFPTRVTKLICILFLLLNDLLCILLAACFANIILLSPDWPLLTIWHNMAASLADFWVWFVPIWLIISTIIGLYHPKQLYSGEREYSLAFTASLLSTFLWICSDYLWPGNQDQQRGWIFLTWLFLFLSIPSGRFLVRRVIFRLSNFHLFQNDAVIVGSNVEACLVTEKILNSRSLGLRISGYIRCQDHSEKMIAILSCLGHLDEFDQIIQKHNVRVVILISSALSREQIVSIFRKVAISKGINLWMSSGTYELITKGSEITKDVKIPLVALNKMQLTGMDLALKTILDYFIAIPAFIILSPLLLFIALTIKLQSTGPVLQVRKAIGVNGKPFGAFHFRTAPTAGARPRVSNGEWIGKQTDPSPERAAYGSRFGRFLRKTSLDGLPLLLNILRNEISLVGPRIIYAEERTPEIQPQIDFLTIKPGLTGLWRMRGSRQASPEERVRYDVYYIRNWNLWMDLQILFQTIGMAFGYPVIH